MPLQLSAFQEPPSRRTVVRLMLGAPLLSGCASGGLSTDLFSSGGQQAAPAGPPQQPTAVGTGQVKVGVVLPLSAQGNAGAAAQSMKNAAEMALANSKIPTSSFLSRMMARMRRARSRRPSRRWTKVQKLFSGRCLRSRFPQRRRLHVDAACR